jgi:hypothetical protein
MKPTGCDRPGGPRRYFRDRSEPRQAAATSAFKPAERDKTMSEEKLTYMQQLDEWTESNVFAPLLSTDEQGESEELSEETLNQVKKAIREKVLESYRNGLKAQPRKLAPAGKGRYAQAQTR